MKQPPTIRSQRPLGPLGLTLLLMLAPAAGLAAEDPGLGLDDFLRLAVESNPNVRAAQLEIDVRRLQADSTKSRLLPVVRVEANAFLWNDAFVFDRYSQELGPLFEPLLPANATPPNLNLNVRDQFVFTTQAAIIEPLGKLYQIYQGRAAQLAMTEAAKHDARTERHQLQHQVVDAYHNHIAASQMSKTVAAALEQVQAFETVTRDHLQAGFVEPDALLKVQVQRQKLVSASIQTNKGIALTRASLNMLAAKPLDTPFRIACLASGSCIKTSSAAAHMTAASLADMQAEAVRARPELQSARSQLEAANRGKKAKRAAMFPDLNAMIAYQHNEGTGEIMPKNAVFGGLALEWNVFEWGATKYEWDAAEAQYEKARAAIEAAENGIRLHVHQRRLELEEALAQTEVTTAEVALAQENLRLEQARYESQNTTATDLLAAQTSLLKAKNEHTVATIKVAAATHFLSLALGRDLLQPAGAPNDGGSL